MVTPLSTKLETGGFANLPCRRGAFIDDARSFSQAKTDCQQVRSRTMNQIQMDEKHAINQIDRLEHNRDICCDRENNLSIA